MTRLSYATVAATPAPNATSTPSENSPRVSFTAASRTCGSGCTRHSRAPERRRLSWHGAEDPAQSALLAVRHRCSDVGVDLAGAEDRVARQVDEDREREQPPAERDDRAEPFVSHDDGEREHSDEQERVPERHGRVREVDVAVPEVSELVTHHRTERGRIGELASDEAAHQRDRVVARADRRRGRSARDRAGSRRQRRLLFEPRLARQLLELVDDGGCLLASSVDADLRRRAIQDGNRSRISAATARRSAVPPTIHHASGRLTSVTQSANALLRPRVGVGVDAARRRAPA